MVTGLIGISSRQAAKSAKTLFCRDALEPLLFAVILPHLSQALAALAAWRQKDRD